jgi:hypothetical protein
MTREYYAFVDSSYAAERAGDAATALEYHRGVPMFTRSAHTVVLTQLAGLSEEMTPWLWARWAAYQCTRAEAPGSGSGEILRFALEYAVRMFYGDLMTEAYDAGDDPVRIIAPTMGEDWAFHQICTFELGGLRAFLDDLATGRLADEAGLARDWEEARMGAYRLEPTEPGRLVVRELATDQSVELLDLGARVHADSEGWLIGRVVPSGTTPSLMFDTRPLPVDEETAQEVARGAKRGAWITALERAFHEDRLDRAILRSEDRELVTDVPSLSLVERGTASAVLASTMEQLRRGRDEVGRAAYRLLRSAAQGALADALAAHVGAAAVQPRGFAEARRTLLHPDHENAWSHWADLAPDPARSRLLRLAELSRAAAA